MVSWGRLGSDRVRNRVRACVYLARNSSYSGICCINLANSNIVIDVIRPLNVNAWEKVRSRWVTSKRPPNDLIFLQGIFNIISQTFRGSAVNISKNYFFWDTLIRAHNIMLNMVHSFGYIQMSVI